MKIISSTALALILFILFCNSYAQEYIDSFEFEGRTRSYEVYLPLNSTSDMPVLLVLHGYGDSVEMIKNYSLLHELGDTTGFITVYPAAIESKWNTGNVPAATANDVGFISALLDTLKAKYEIDSYRIYCCGFGQGGAMSYKLGGELSNRIAAVASVGGLMCEAMLPTCNPIREIPVFHIHGTADQYEPWEGGAGDLKLLSIEEIINVWVQNNNCSPFYNTFTLPDNDPNDGCTVEKTNYNNNEGDITVTLYKVNNGGHNWPGAFSDYNWEGNKTGDIDANTELLNFFKNFSLPEVSVEAGNEVIPNQYSLKQNYPNPFNPSTTLKYEIPKESYIMLKVYDILGREVATLVNKQQKAGYYEVNWNAANNSSGVYFYRIQAGDYVDTKKMLLLR